MVSTHMGYVIVDDYDQIWIETVAPSCRKAWVRMGEVCAVPKAELLKRGFKCVCVEIQTEEYKR